VARRDAIDELLTSWTSQPETATVNPGRHRRCCGLPHRNR
jgi:hypothetical protein